MPGVAHQVVEPLEQQVRLVAVATLDGLALFRLEGLQPAPEVRYFSLAEDRDREEIALAPIVRNGIFGQHLRHGGSFGARGVVNAQTLVQIMPGVMARIGPAGGYARTDRRAH